MCNDASTIVWEEIESVLRAFEKLSRGDDAMNAAMMAFGQNMLASLDRRVGWKPKAEDGHMGKMLRAVLIRLQAAFCKSDEDVAAKAHALFETPDSIPNDLKSAVYKIALQSSSASDGAARHATMMGASRCCLFFFPMRRCALLRFAAAPAHAVPRRAGAAHRVHLVDPSHAPRRARRRCR